MDSFVWNDVFFHRKEDVKISEIFDKMDRQTTFLSDSLDPLIDLKEVTLTLCSSLVRLTFNSMLTVFEKDNRSVLYGRIVAGAISKHNSDYSASDILQAANDFSILYMRARDKDDAMNTLSNEVSKFMSAITKPISRHSGSVACAELLFAIYDLLYVVYDKKLKAQTFKDSMLGLR